MPAPGVRAVKRRLRGRLPIRPAEIYFDPLVESFDALDEPFRRFLLTASRSYWKHGLFLTTRSGADSAFISSRIDNSNKGEIMDTILIVLLVVFLLGGGGWGYSRWRR